MDGRREFGSAYPACGAVAIGTRARSETRCRAVSLSPARLRWLVSDDRLRALQLEGGQVRSACFQVVLEEILVELWWPDVGSGQHGVHLPAVMDLVHEEVRERVADRLVVDALRAAVDADNPAELLGGEAIAEADQPLIRGDLVGSKNIGVLKRLAGLEMRIAELPALQGIQVKEIDLQDVVQRGLDRREKSLSAGPGTPQGSSGHKHRATASSTRRCCAPCAGNE